MGIKNSNSKGDISIENFRGRIRLRFRCERKRYTFNLGMDYSEENLQKALSVSSAIKLDILHGKFDSTLNKYKPPNPSSTEPFPSLDKKISEYYIHWITVYKHGNLSTNSNFSQILNLIKKWEEEFPDNKWLNKVPELLSRKICENSTFNRRFSTLNEFFEFLVRKICIKKNPLEGISRRTSKNIKKVKHKRLPLNEKEIHKLLEAIRLDKYSTGTYRHSYYYPFLYCMFRLGLRNEECIGLRVKYVFLTEKYIRIAEVMARSKKGANSAYRIRKGVKNGKEREIPIEKDLIELLAPLLRDKGADDLIFPGVKGGCIDDRMLQNRILKTIMKRLHIDKRDLYCARHSFASRGIQQGIPIPQLAELMGINIDTLMRNYVHLVEKPTKIPEMKGK